MKVDTRGFLLKHGLKSTNYGVVGFILLSESVKGAMPSSFETHNCKRISFTIKKLYYRDLQ